MATITLNVTGMKCGGCEKQITEALQATAGVATAQASHKAGTVAVEYDDSKADLEKIKKTIRGKGFEVA